MSDEFNSDPAGHVVDSIHVFEPSPFIADLIGANCIIIKLDVYGSSIVCCVPLSMSHGNLARCLTVPLDLVIAVEV